MTFWLRSTLNVSLWMLSLPPSNPLKFCFYILEKICSKRLGQDAKLKRTRDERKMRKCMRKVFSFKIVISDFSWTCWIDVVFHWIKRFIVCYISLSKSYKKSTFFHQRAQMMFYNSFVSSWWIMTTSMKQKKRLHSISMQPKKHIIWFTFAWKCL